MTKGYYSNLEDRTTQFAIQIMRLSRRCKSDSFREIVLKQLIRSSGSIGANYREANEGFTKKEFIYRLKISRKEIKESLHWLVVLKDDAPQFVLEIEAQIAEAKELLYIFTSIISKIKM